MAAIYSIFVLFFLSSLVDGRGRKVPNRPSKNPETMLGMHMEKIPDLIYQDVANYSEIIGDAQDKGISWPGQLDTDLPATRVKRNGRIGDQYRWTTFSVYIDESYSFSERYEIAKAMYELWEIIPCIDFKLWPQGSTPTGDYVYISNGQGCWSLIGREGGKQDMSLAPECMHSYIILHEMIHALGFLHEQASPNRDDYVTVHYQNIAPGGWREFRKFPSNLVTTFGVPYNSKSIMHYSSAAFSKNDEPTITLKNGEYIHYNKEITDTDKQKLQAMYKCTNGGYPSKSFLEFFFDW